MMPQDWVDEQDRDAEQICGHCGLPLVDGETAEDCRKMHEITAKLSCKAVEAYNKVAPSWVIFFKDGRYAYAWGETAEQARINYLKEWAEGIARIESAGEQRNALPSQSYVPNVSKGLR